MNAALDLSPEQMRAIGYRVIDAIVEHFSTLKDRPVGFKGDPATLLSRFAGPPPETGTEFAPLLERLRDEVFRNTMHVDHPRFFAYVPGPGNIIGAMADALATGFNVFTGTWIGGSGAAAVELATLDWLRDWCGFPATAAGQFVSGGSMANFTGLAVARHVKLGENIAGATVYYSDQAHSSLEKALRLLGIPRESIRKLPSDSDFRLPVDELARQIAEDRAAGLRPYCVVANAGTTNTGAVDPLPELSRLCREQNLWLHVDGAYGAAAVIAERGRAALAGMELADSLSLDPHKWLFQPFEIGCILVREERHLRSAFQIMPEYLQDTYQRPAEVNLTDYGLQLTRGFRALKLWLSLQFFGLAAFREAVARGFESADFIERSLRAMPGWEIVTPSQMGIVCFRFSNAGDAMHLRLVQTMLQDGYALFTSTALRGRTVLRACAINPRTTEMDIEESLRRLDRFARSGDSRGA
jgi:aromatic-L-amino-acid/L-tryptophan decarboxylase